MSAPERKNPVRQAWKALARATAKRTLRWAGPVVLGRLARTWQVEELGQGALARAAAPGGGQIMALWHGRMLIPLPHRAHSGWQVLVSASEDGDMSERLLEAFGYRIIRGSRSRGGARALREMRAVAARGEVLVVTPDGPRGPRHSMNPGLAWLARATGYAVVPCGVVCDRAWRMSSWDRFTIPKRNARIVLVYEEPVRVPPDADEETQRAATEDIRAGMLRAEQRGFGHLGVESDW